MIKSQTKNVRLMSSNKMRTLRTTLLIQIIWRIYAHSCEGLGKAAKYCQPLFALEPSSTISPEPVLEAKEVSLVPVQPIRVPRDFSEGMRPNTYK